MEDQIFKEKIEALRRKMADTATLVTSPGSESSPRQLSHRRDPTLSRMGGSRSTSYSRVSSASPSRTVDDSPLSSASESPVRYQLTPPRHRPEVVEARARQYARDARDANEVSEPSFADSAVAVVEEYENLPDDTLANELLRTPGKFDDDERSDITGSVDDASVQVRDGSVDEMVVLLQKQGIDEINQLGEAALEALQHTDDGRVASGGAVGSSGSEHGGSLLDTSVAAHDGSEAGFEEVFEEVRSPEDQFFDYLADTKAESKPPQPLAPPPPLAASWGHQSGGGAQPGSASKRVPSLNLASAVWEMAQQNDLWVQSSMRSLPADNMVMLSSRSLQVLASPCLDSVPATNRQHNVKQGPVRGPTGPTKQALVTTWPRGMPKIRVHFLRNDGVATGDLEGMEGSTHVFSSLAAMMDHATQFISSRKAIRRLFMVSGVEVLELEDLIKLRMQGQTSVHLVASAGQVFKPRIHNPAFQNSPEQEKALRTSRGSTRGTPRRTPGGSTPRGNTPRGAAPRGATSRGGRSPPRGLFPSHNPAKSASGRSTPRAGQSSGRTSVATPRQTTPNKRLKVALFRNGRGSTLHETGVPVLVYSMQSLLDDASVSLNLPRAARRIFTANGTEINSLVGIPHMAEVYVSMGEDFYKSTAKKKIIAPSFMRG